MDLIPSTVIAITQQINDLAELRNRQANFSNRIKLPKTQRNLGILQQADLITSVTMLPYRLIDAKVVKDGVELVPEGYAIIDNTDQYINVTIYSGIFDFFTVLGEQVLHDLDLSEHDHTFDLLEAIDTFTNTEGLKYSLVDRGEMSLAGNPPLVLFVFKRPSIFMHTLVKAVIEQAGYSYSGKIFSDDNFNKVLVSMYNGDQRSRYYSRLGILTTGDWTEWPPTRDTPHFICEGGRTLNITVRYAFKVTNWTNSLSEIRFQVTLDGSTLMHEYHHTDIDGAGHFDKSFSFSYANGGATRNVTIKMIVLSAGYRFHFGEVTAQYSDEDEPRLFCRISDFPKNVRSTDTTNDDHALGMDLEAHKIPNEQVQQITSHHVPNMKQTDFLKSVAQMFGLLFVCDTFRRTLKLIRFDEIVENIPYARDWSDKLADEKHREKIEFRLGSYAQRNLLKYKADSSDPFVSPTLGEGYITVDDETLAKEATMLELGFAASRMFNADTPNQDPVPVATQIEDGQAGSIVPRLWIDDTQGSGEVHYTQDEGVTAEEVLTNIPLCYFQKAGKDFNLGFDNSLIDDNYTALSQVLNKCKRITVKMKLDVIDVADFDHTLPIYLSQYAAYFYVNKIVNFTGSGLTQVELIRLQTDYTSQSTEDVNAIDPPENYELQEDGGFSLGEDGSILLREDGN